MGLFVLQHHSYPSPYPRAAPLRRRRSGDVEETGRVFSIDDRQPGKTAVGIDIILSWKLRNDGPGESKKLCCIYIAVGQKPFTVIQLVQVLKKNDAVKYTSIFAATATEATFLQCLSSSVALPFLSW
ncbi:hypothetical protein A4X06_0g5301 [Tilletia controversa]|uniref:ATPase F1/V1/A1 complex alpha/beta subunit nucleotide-binding domain-containing protein n=3 Tax=Tilletia TaxID=13289 RepID=A0A8X7MRP6_9BASI|nr:hypothetical protein CF328_g6825 [Tilletia controversa]KAE8190171.1 hypothetical protein CF336_g5426 [Tilletia laevis]KAE8245951.1 hypothetical protein A4X06_0g5301 [Tilletia controversa]KAE8246566.1 hypothetical protein A4X03_0g7244 [Tilletia caries]